jgi:hypothetical protein
MAALRSVVMNNKDLFAAGTFPSVEGSGLRGPSWGLRGPSWTACGRFISLSLIEMA